MLALTLKHPWPFAVARLGKDVENRTWRPRGLSVGQWFIIHGGAQPTSKGQAVAIYQEAVLLIAEHGRISAFREHSATDILDDVLDCSGVVAACKFGGVVTDPASGGDWFEGPIGWRLTDVFVLPEPIACKGAQGLWTLPDDVRAEVRRQYAETHRPEPSP